MCIFFFYREGILLSNRGNYLLLSLLKYRFPTLFDNETQQNYAKEVLSKPLDRTKLEAASEAICEQFLESYFRSNDKAYPVYIGESLDVDDKTQLVLYLVGKLLCFSIVFYFRIYIVSFILFFS